MSERLRLALVVGLYLLTGIGYSLLMPMWEAPDERAHYGYVLHLARNGESPSMEENYEAHQPPFYYAVMAIPVRWLETIDPDWSRPVRPPLLEPQEFSPRYDWNRENYAFLLAPLVLRWLGLVCGALTLWAIYAGVRRAFPDEPGLALGIVALIGGIPQFIHITASVSNDVFAILSGGLLFLGLAEIISRPAFSAVWAASGLAALVLPVLVKLTLLPLSIAVLAALLLRTRVLHPARITRFTVLGVGLLLASVLILLAASPASVDRFVEEIQYRLLIVRPGALDDSSLRVVGRYLWNFWGKVGWLSVGIPFGAAAALTGLCGVGILFAYRSIYISDRELLSLPGRQFVSYATLAIAAAVLMLLRNFMASPQLQGRFLFPTLGPIALLIVYGWRRMLGGRDRYLTPVVIVAMALLNLHLWLTGVIPVYYQPFLDP